MEYQDIKRKLNWDTIIVGAAFTFYFLITMYKLTNASLWYDEGVEYWYSKILVGTIPEMVNSHTICSNMYERIVSTFQPPLYNILLYFWLKVSDSVWWFRFFGVVMGFIGMVGIFKSVKKITHHTLIASVTVIFSYCIYQLVYYWQEASEYCLMIGSLCWTIYYWMCLMEKASRKNVILFIVTAVIPVYSQYGAAFLVVALAFTALIETILKREKKPIIQLSIAYGCALLFAALPLYMFFLKKQMATQQGGTVTFSGISFEGNLITDMCKNLGNVFVWNITSYYSKETSKILLIIVLSAFLVALIKGNRICRWLILVNFLTWILYYITVKVGVYSYGRFGERYNLFFIPLWVVSGVAVCITLYDVITKSRLQKWDISSIYVGALLCCCVSFCFFAWTAKLQHNWGKENNKLIVDKWYEQNAQESNTLVYYGATPCFSYYVQQHDDYNETTEDRVTYMSFYRNKTDEEYAAYINSVYGMDWPEEIYIVLSHIKGDAETLIRQFTNRGYNRENLFDSNGKLVRLTYVRTEE